MNPSNNSTHHLYSSGMRQLSSCVLLVLLLASGGCVQGAVLGVDLGSEWMRIGLVKPGVPMEIVLNKESRRKSPMNVYISKDERLIGDDSTASKKPQNTHKYFTRTLGALPSNPLVKDYQDDFPELRLSPDKDSPDTLLYATGYTAEEVLGMMLNYSRQISEDFAELKPIRDIVLTVPPYFNQAQRRAVLRAANLSEIKVINLMNSNLAVALHYASFQREAYKQKPLTVLFFDMGATATTATVVKLEQPEGKSANPKVTVLGTGFDRYLGGALIDKRLAHHLATEFMQQLASKNIHLDVFKSHRAMAKLLKEAKRVKNVLSANAEHYAHIESLIDDKDMKILVTRTELERICDDLFDRIPDVLNEALEAAKIIRGELDSVVPVGGSSRVPKVQDIVLSTLNKNKFTMTINRDEAAAMGAIYLGASLSKGFKVQEFLLQDASIYPIEISYEKRIPTPIEPETEVLKETEYRTKIIHKVLFHRSNQLPQKKIMTFKNITKDLVLHASYVTDENWLNMYDREVLTQGRYPNGSEIARIEVKGVGEVLAELGEEDFRGVKVHFSVDEDGLFTCTRAEAVFEEKLHEQSTIDSILSFFSSSDKKETQNETKQVIENSTNSSNTTLDGNSTRTENKTLKPNLKTHPLEVITTLLDYPDPSESSMVQSRQKLLTLALRDEEKKLREIAQNNLEAFIYDLKERLFKDEAIAVSSEEQREEMASEVMRVSEWLFEQDGSTNKEEFNEKYHALREITVDLYIRIREKKELPKALQTLNQTFNATEQFIESMAVYSNVSKLVFTEGDYKLLSRQYNETKSWLEKATAEQAKTPAHENPPLTVSLVDTQRVALENELRYLVNKLKYWKPPKQPSPTPPVAPPPAEGNDTSNSEDTIEVDLGGEEVSERIPEPEMPTPDTPEDLDTDESKEQSETIPDTNTSKSKQEL